MSDTETKIEKPAKAKASNGLNHDDNETAMALALFRSIPADERKEYLSEAQMSHLGRQAFAFLADGYFKLTGEKMSQVIILDGETGIFEEAEFEDDGDEDEDAIDATEGEGDDEEEEEEEEPEYTGLQAVRMLRKWMKAHGYSQAYAANKLKVTQPAVSTWLQKTSLPREASIQRIVRLCSK